MDMQEILSNSMLYLEQGGYVMYPLMFFSVWMWYLIAKKLAELSFGKRGKNRNSDIQAVVKEFQEKQINDSAWNRRLLLSLIRKRQQELEKHVQTIFVLASLAPLLGLLGTVTGMISTFEAISRFGRANVRAMSSGISEALITTQIGLVLAIPGLFTGHFIRGRAGAAMMRLEVFYKKMLNEK